VSMIGIVAAFFAGMALSMRFVVWILVPVFALAALLTAVVGVIRGDEVWRIALGIAVLVTALQFGYLAGILLTIARLSAVNRKRRNCVRFQQTTAKPPSIEARRETAAAPLLFRRAQHAPVRRTTTAALLPLRRFGSRAIRLGEPHFVCGVEQPGSSQGS
jgi:hypothetical protein